MHGWVGNYKEDIHASFDLSVQCSRGVVFFIINVVVRHVLIAWTFVANLVRAVTFFILPLGSSIASFVDCSQELLYVPYPKGVRSQQPRAATDRGVCYFVGVHLAVDGGGCCCTACWSFERFR